MRVFSILLLLILGVLPLSAIESGRFTLDLVPGRFYQTTTKWLWFDVPVYPQVAVWVETPEGRFLETLFVTAKAATRGWVSAPPSGRPEALPVWSSRHRGGTEAVTAATSAGETRAEAGPGALPPGPYVLFLETNRSYDYNLRFTRKNSGVDGQPSVVYRIDVNRDPGPRTLEFVPIGKGSVGSDGEFIPGLDGIDTALELFSRLSVTVRD